MVLCWSVLPASTAAAHSDSDLHAWVQEWVAAADYSLSPPLIAEWYDMVARQPAFFNPTPQEPAYATHTHARPGGSRMGSGGAQVEAWRPLVAVYFTAGDVPTAMCLLAAESGGNPDAENPRSSAAGLFQFLKGTWNSVPLSVTGGTYGSGVVFNGEANIKAAAWLKAAAGWTQWSPYKAGRCRGL